MSPWWFLAAIAILVVVSVLNYRAGWLAANAYLQAAKSMSDVADSTAARAQSFADAMNGQVGEIAKLRAELERFRGVMNDNTRTLGERFASYEAGIQTLFEGFERAGFVRTAGKRDRQVGESTPDERGEG